MAFERATLIDRMEVLRDGTLQVRMKKIALKDGGTLGFEYHRMSLPPGADAEQTIEAVNLHLRSMQAAAMDAPEIDKTHRWAGRFHDTTTIDAYREKRAREARGERPPPVTDGEVVFKLVAASFRTPADPPERIDRLVAAAPVMLVAGLVPVALPQLDVEPGATPNRELLTAIGAMDPGAGEWKRLGAVVALEHTADVVTAHRARPRAEPRA